MTIVVGKNGQDELKMRDFLPMCDRQWTTVTEHSNGKVVYYRDLWVMPVSGPGAKDYRAPGKIALRLVVYGDGWNLSGFIQHRGFAVGQSARDYSNLVHVHETYQLLRIRNLGCNDVAKRRMMAEALALVNKLGGFRDVALKKTGQGRSRKLVAEERKKAAELPNKIEALGNGARREL